jgi:apolipoprotein N-acyltransferase
MTPAAEPTAPPPPAWVRHRDLLIAGAVFVLTVVLTVICFPPRTSPEFAYVFAAPAVFWAYTRPRLRLYAWTLFAAQAVSWTILLSWLRHVTWGGWLLLGPFVGAWVGVWYLAAWWAMPRIAGRPTPIRLAGQLGLAAAWVVLEWTRTWFLGGFPWLPLAASQWQRPSILQIASYTGETGVSFVLIAANVGFAAYANRLFREGAVGLAKRSQEFFLALFLLLVCLSIMIQGAVNRRVYDEPLARVAFVQPDIPQTLKWDPAQVGPIVDVLGRTTHIASLNLPDLILWPEGSTPYPVQGHLGMRAFVERQAAQAHATLLIGSDAVEQQGTADEKWYNAAFAVDPSRGVLSPYYAKRKLVPFGEYVPFRPLFGWLQKVVPIGPDDFQHGTDPTPLVVDLHHASYAAGVLICYEDIFPGLARSEVQAGADFLVVLTNDAWYGHEGAAVQHAADSVLRAVETRRPVLRCGNDGWSGWIDEFGNIRSVLSDPRYGIYVRGERTVDVTRDRRWDGVPSFYVAHGDWFVWACAAWALFSGLLLAAGSPAISRVTTADDGPKSIFP